MSGQDAALVVTLQDHRRTIESWGVGTLLVHEILGGHVPSGVSLGCEVSAVGDRLGLAAPGERLEVQGTWELTKWGRQLRVREQVSRGLHGATDAARWLERLDGVGPVLAHALKKRWGDQLPAILAGEVEADLTEVRGISEEKAKHIRESFAELAIAGDLESIRYLDSIKATRWEATQIMQWCAKRRRRPIEVLERAPFDLMDVKGLGFKRVDRLARAAGCAPTAPARLDAATMHALGEIVQRGSTMAPFAGGRGGGLIGETCELLGLTDKDLARAAVRRLAARGEVVIATDEKERTWVHPASLLRAERSIYQAAKGGRPKHKACSASRSSGGSPGALPDQATVPRREEQVGAATANGGQCQDAERRGEGVPAPARTPAAAAVSHHDDSIPARLARASAHLAQIGDGAHLEDWQ